MKTQKDRRRKTIAGLKRMVAVTLIVGALMSTLMVPAGAWFSNGAGIRTTYYTCSLCDKRFTKKSDAYCHVAYDHALPLVLTAFKIVTLKK